MSKLHFFTEFSLSSLVKEPLCSRVSDKYKINKNGNFHLKIFSRFE